MTAPDDRSACRGCGNVFLQPFVCITCGAQKLYDATLASAQKRAEKAEAATANAAADDAANAARAQQVRDLIAEARR